MSEKKQIDEYKKLWLQFLGTHDGKGNSEVIVYNEPVTDAELFVEAFALDNMYIENKEFIINLRYEYETKYTELMTEARKLREALEIEMGNSGTRQAEEALSNFDAKYPTEEK